MKAPSIKASTLDVDSALLDLEGILHALEMIRFEGALNKPGPEFHAMAVLSKLAVEHAAKLRLTLFPETRGSSEGAAP